MKTNSNFIQKLMNGAREYSVFDFGVLKFALLFVGMLLGVYFHEFLAGQLYVLWCLAIVTYVYIVLVTLKKAFRKR